MDVGSGKVNFKNFKVDEKRLSFARVKEKFKGYLSEHYGIYG